MGEGDGRSGGFIGFWGGERRVADNVPAREWKFFCYRCKILQSGNEM